MANRAAVRPLTRNWRAVGGRAHTVERLAFCQAASSVSGFNGGLTIRRPSCAIAISSLPAASDHHFAAANGPVDAGWKT